MKMKNKKAIQDSKRIEKNKRISDAKASRRMPPNFERKAPNKDPRARILIYCEGKNTEPSYFQQFKLPNVTVFGEGKNTLSLVKKAITLRNEVQDTENRYDEVWCVFDRDPPRTNSGGHSAENFNRAVKLAQKEGIRLAYSIQAFEYWIILHFNDHQGGSMSRDDYNKLINKYLKAFGCSYAGNDEKLVTYDMFNILEGRDGGTGKIRWKQAIERARRIYNEKSPHDNNPANAESVTTVYELVEVLKKMDHANPELGHS